MIRFRPKDGTVINSLRRVEGTNKWVPVRSLSSLSSPDVEIWYTFAGRVYRTRTWPVVKTGFVIPWIKSDPDVPWFYSYAGPKRDFHGSDPVLPTRIRRFPSPHIECTGKGFRLTIGIGYLFEYGKCKLTNLLNQHQLLTSHVC